MKEKQNIIYIIYVYVMYNIFMLYILSPSNFFFVGYNFLS